VSPCCDYAVWVRWVPTRYGLNIVILFHGDLWLWGRWHLLAPCWLQIMLASFNLLSVRGSILIVFPTAGRRLKGVVEILLPPPVIRWFWSSSLLCLLQFKAEWDVSPRDVQSMLEVLLAYPTCFTFHRSTWRTSLTMNFQRLVPWILLPLPFSSSRHSQVIFG